MKLRSKKGISYLVGVALLTLVTIGLILSYGAFVRNWFSMMIKKHEIESRASIYLDAERNIANIYLNARNVGTGELTVEKIVIVGLKNLEATFTSANSAQLKYDTTTIAGDLNVQEGVIFSNGKLLVPTGKSFALAFRNIPNARSLFSIGRTYSIEFQCVEGIMTTEATVSAL